MGMRKDFLLSCQEKPQKQKRVESNRNPPEQCTQLTAISSTFEPESNDEQLDDIDQVGSFPSPC